MSKYRRCCWSIILMILISFSFTSGSFADNTTDPAKPMERGALFNHSSNRVYRWIQAHESFLTPLASGMAGVMRCWPKDNAATPDLFKIAMCGLGGLIVGAADELAIYFGYTDRHYLTWGLFGATTGHVIQPSRAADLSGVIVGVLLPTGILNQCSGGLAPAVGAAAGGLVAGPIGACYGGIAGILDEFLLANDWAHKNYQRHYLTLGTLGMTTVNLLGYFTPPVANAIGMLLGGVVANYETGVIDGILAPITATKELYAAYGKFIPKGRLDQHLERHAIVAIGSQFLAQFLSLKIAGYQQALTYNFERLNDNAGPAWGNFQQEITNFAIFLFPYIGGQWLTRNVGEYFGKNLEFALADKINAELFVGEIPLRLANDPNATVLMDNFKNDITTVVSSGNQLISGAISTAVNGVYGLGVIVVNSPNIFVYSALYNQASAWVAERMVAQQRFYGEKLTGLNSQWITAMKHNNENIRTITERDGIPAVRDQVENFTHELRNVEEMQRLWSSVNQIWWSVLGNVDFMLNYYLTAREVQQGRIPFANRGMVQTASWQVSNLLSWSGRSVQDLSWIRQSLDRVVILEGKIHKVVEPIDQIIRKTGDDRYLTIRDLEMGIKERSLLQITQLALELGKVYALTGESGCGKTSLLSKIKGIRENGVYGKGAIDYPPGRSGDPKIVMISQQDYFPLEATLEEVLAYPDKIPLEPSLRHKFRETAQELLVEVGLNGLETHDSVKGSGLNLDSKRDWYTGLSGGEKKKITTVAAILKQPDILVLDEVFNGLDHKSIGVLQRMLKKHLPDSLILVVDHHARENNEKFYDQELFFDNQSITLRELS